MARNIYFTHGRLSEQNLYEDVIIESLKIYGQDMHYIPRDYVKIDEILGEDPISSFDSSYILEMYVDNVDGFDGEGDLFSKFGVEIRDAVTLTVSKRRWKQAVKKYDNGIALDRPSEGDLIYVPYSKKLFEIMHVEHEQPFYQLNNLPVYKLRCELFEYQGEDFDTGIVEVDNIESIDYHVELTLLDPVPGIDTINFLPGTNVYQNIDSDVTMNAEVINWNAVNNKLKIGHFGSSDGVFRESFTTGALYRDSDGSDLLLGTVTSFVNIQPEANIQNDEFKAESDGFLDFSESNPFGDLEL